jgi:hypothetical protein
VVSFHKFPDGSQPSPELPPVICPASVFGTKNVIIHKTTNLFYFKSEHLHLMTHKTLAQNICLISKEDHLIVLEFPQFSTIFRRTKGCFRPQKVFTLRSHLRHDSLVAINSKSPVKSDVYAVKAVSEALIESVICLN